ncbi:UPF0462 protein C4orf33-like [Parasteatoda tepidariorum]|uniref:UPF0462 protein C4orf33-like n=1 Tax=Parasteatoda tepidariorum TaxID=114398 RepID=UPI0039BC31D6
MEFSILTTWDDKPIDHEATIIKLHSEDDVVIMEIKAPFYDDPPPNPRGTDKSFNKLWDYEVVEAFFLGKAEKYLELEFSPHGFYFVLLLAGRKNAIKFQISFVKFGKCTENTFAAACFKLARKPRYLPIIAGARSVATKMILVKGRAFNSVNGVNK